jgi:predicted  nucleic acid-binding Zn-ribbon protein
MSKPTTLSSALEALEASSNRVLALEADLTAANAIIAEASELQQVKAKLETDNADLLTKLTEANSQLTALSANAQTAEARANEIVAALGVPPVAISQEPAEAIKSKDDLWAEYHKLPIEARNKFYQQNRAAMRSN